MKSSVNTEHSLCHIKVFVLSISTDVFYMSNCVAVKILKAMVPQADALLAWAFRLTFATFHFHYKLTTIDRHSLESYLELKITMELT